MLGEQMRSEMSEQPGVLDRLVARFDADVAAVAALRPRDLAGTVFIGRGSSDNAAQLGRYLTEECSGRPAGLGAISLHTRNHARVDYTGYVAAVFSQSGRTPEIVTAAEAVRTGGGRVIAVTNDEHSPLAAVADVVLPIAAGPELAVPATKTVTAQLLLAGAVAAGLAQPGRPGITAAQLRGLAAATRSVLERADAESELARSWRDSPVLLVTGRGPGLAAAAEIALKIRETTGVGAQAMSTADLLHGPIAAIGAQVPVLLVGAAGALQADVLEAADQVRARSADARLWPAAVPGTGPADVLTSAIVAVVRGQQLAFAWSDALRIDPDRPGGLAKITLTR